MHPTPLSYLLGLALLTASLGFARQVSDDITLPSVFQHSESCKRCHDRSDGSSALTTEDGADASPHGTWKATMMAQAFYDPYWRAKMAREIEIGALPREDIEALCLRCHAPAAHHQDRMLGEPGRSFAELVESGAAQDGVNCSVCHRMTGEGLGTPETFSGLAPFDFEARIHGPYPEPITGPMVNMTGYEPTYGPHMVLSSQCATCHTLFTPHGEGAFPEQTPYLEWRNSVFSYEDGIDQQSRSCQACHMEDQGELVIAHNPMGGDFPFLEPRPEVRGHRFMGGNAFMLELLADNAEELDLAVTPDDLRTTARETSHQLSRRSAALAVENLRREEGALRFDVQVRNLTGHKLPTAYPSRRAWLEVTVDVDGRRWFESGVADEQGRLSEESGGTIQPHYQSITAAGQVQVYELVPLDDRGEATTHLTRMARRGKDNRLLPRGWRADGPGVEVTAPHGVEGDRDFVGGEDRVAFDLAGVPSGEVSVKVRLMYQSIAPAWVDALRPSKTEEARWFVEAYDRTPHKSRLLARAQGRL